MSRRNRAEEAQKAASEAGRILQSQRNFGDAVEAVEPESKGDDAPQKSPTPEKNPRTIALEEIANARRPEGVEEEPEAKKEPEKKEPEASVTDAPKVESKPEEQEQQPEAQAPATVMTRQKVDGKEYEVPQAEIDEAGGEKAWRINKAAQNRLEEAKAALAESRRTQAALADFVQRSVQPQNQQPTLTDDQFIASKIDTIRFGTPDESAAALKEILHRAAKPVDQNQITAHVLSEMQKTQAVEKFKTEFQDLLANPMVLRLAVALEQDRLPQLQKQGPVDWETFYRTIGNEVRSVVGRSSQPAKATVEAPVGNTSQTDKETRKASIVNLPTASTRATVKEDPKPETREDILNDMRKRRGIPIG